MPIVKSTEKTSYTNIKNHIIENKELSIDAKFILIWLLRKPKNWKIRKENMKNDLGIGRDKLNNALAELTKAGHLKDFQPREGGRYKKSKYTVYEDPILPAGINQEEQVQMNSDTKIQKTEKPQAEKPYTEKEQQTTTDSLGTNIYIEQPSGESHKIQIDDLPKILGNKKGDIFEKMDYLNTDQSFGILAIYNNSKASIKKPTAWFLSMISKCFNSEFALPDHHLIEKEILSSINRQKTKGNIRDTLAISETNCIAPSDTPPHGDFNSIKNSLNKRLYD